MEKLKLVLDAITIESFEPVAGGHRGEGTIRGRSETDVEQTDCCASGTWGSCGTNCTDGWTCYEAQCATDLENCPNTNVKLCTIDYCHSIGAC